MREVRGNMELTRRDFVTTLGVLATALGLSQTDLAKVTEAFAHGAPWGAGSPLTGKPKVIWIHGAECTGCSTSAIGLIEDARGVAVPGLSLMTSPADKIAQPDTTTIQALAIIAGADPTNLGLTEAVAAATPGHRTLNSAVPKLNVDGSDYAVNIQDVLIDFIDLQYHETVMGMGGDGAYGYLAHEMAADDGTAFVLVVEGAVQEFSEGGYWGKAGETGDAPWCSVAMDGTSDAEHDLSFDKVVEDLAKRNDCKAVVAVGQCAAFGGYPACSGPDLAASVNGKNQTGAKGVYDFLIHKNYYTIDVETGQKVPTGAAAKVINVPGCPVNPWWFTLTVVAWLVDAVYASTFHTDGVLGILDSSLAIKGGVDSQRRLTAVYGNLLHGEYCPRYQDYADRIFVSKPGQYVTPSTAGGCLKNIGCKGLSTMSSCGRHGWNNQQPQNAMNDDPTKAIMYDAAGTTVSKIGGCCLTAGAPCMGCTEKGYPDAFTPFVVR
jgi:Ni,Fe-hydrogenase I small subunit